MDRRNFLKGATVALGGSTAVAMPAIAQSAPEVRWRLTSSYPKSLDTLFGGAMQLAKRVAEATDNKFQIQPFAAGEIVGPLQAMDAVQNGTVECAQTLANFYIGKDPAFVFESCVPFGLNVRQQNAWLYEGGGLQLVRDLLKSYNIHTMPMGNTGAQMGGWFRKEIKSVADLNGLKFRVAGLAGQILAKLGVVPQQIGAGDIYPALERGTLDAAEFSGPEDDEKLGLYKVAKYYYYPGWWETAPNVSLFINMDKWNALPRSYQAILESASTEVLTQTVAKYDARNADALLRLVANGTELKPFPADVLEASYKEAQAFYDQLAQTNPNFKKIYEPWKQFWHKENTWFRVAELPLDAFISSRAQRRN